MANPEHVAKLKEGVEAWNAWREECPDVRPDLRGIGLHEPELAPVVLRWLHMRNADLREADLKQVDLRWGWLAGSNFECADLVGAVLQGADVEGCNFRGANLKGANLRNLQGFQAWFDGANLEGAILEGANVRRASFARARLQDANFSEAQLKRNDFMEANVDGADFRFVAPDSLEGCFWREATGRLLWDGEGEFLPFGKSGKFLELQIDTDAGPTEIADVLDRIVARAYDHASVDEPQVRMREGYLQLVSATAEDVAEVRALLQDGPPPHIAERVRFRDFILRDATGAVILECDGGVLRGGAQKPE
jgi:uncharacterized protein YjbI with pentapeptide repeats